MHARPGDLLGPYLLGPVLGTGGSGAVFAASGPLDAPGVPPRLAVKVVPAAREVALRAEAEVQRAAACAQVLPVLDVVVDDGRTGLVTPLLPDGDLAAQVRAGGPLPRAAALDVLGDVAGALATTHAAGFVHGDVAPGNVLLRRRGPRLEALLADFGAARPIGQVASGVVRATRHWVAPEVAAGAPPGPAGDVHALGALLVLMLTGAPWGGGGGAASAALPPGLRGLLAPDPAVRPSARQVARSVGEVPPSSGRGRRGWRTGHKK